MKPTLISLSPRDREMLDAEAARLGVSRAAVVRILVREHLAPREASR
jgi:hypothetical protein